MRTLLLFSVTGASAELLARCPGNDLAAGTKHRIMVDLESPILSRRCDVAAIHEVQRKNVTGELVFTDGHGLEGFVEARVWSRLIDALARQVASPSLQSSVAISEDNGLRRVDLGIIDLSDVKLEPRER